MVNSYKTFLLNRICFLTIRIHI